MEVVLTMGFSHVNFSDNGAKLSWYYHVHLKVSMLTLNVDIATCRTCQPGLQHPKAQAGESVSEKMVPGKTRVSKVVGQVL
ncbi:hypothetical protein OIU74_011519 [Salix koriyanagi]|uniref:Uncharacterized protein n=2 Tax=Salix TaxID=40685 RepID=A0A9Q0YUL7_9ROSI|nr:hypothetical protein OIU74_011519 [Salix koriyanagi]